MCRLKKRISLLMFILSIQIAVSFATRSSKLLFSEQEIVEKLLKKWSPLVWLAPNEKFLPGNVKTFLSNVHAEREKPNSQRIKDIGDNLNKYSNYYEDLVYYDGTSNVKKDTINNRRRRNFDKDTSLEQIFELPINDASEEWFLVTNEELDNLMNNESSFIYGETPSAVQVYAVVSLCSSEKDFKLKNEIDINSNKWKKNPYIPLTKDPEIFKYNSLHIEPNKPTVSNEFRPLDEIDKIDDASLNEINTLNRDHISQFIRKKRNSEFPFDAIPKENITNNGTYNHLNATNSWKHKNQQPTVVIYTKEENFLIPTASSNVKDAKKHTKNQRSSTPKALPHFHVSYWMFYPYSQGKTICTLNLGPLLGPIPIPLIWNQCFGTKKDFGSHVGDWEHISMIFRGKMEPDEMYVSVHDSGAYYSYSKLTNTFEYKSQETREGILQRPIFPKTVVTSDSHPVLFAAEGSHGLWSSPGKHRFVRMPRLYDINGFGRPWETWQNIEIIYNSGMKIKRSINPNWMKYRGRWGNPKNKCHPLKRIGLHVCELTDGPFGIPKKTSHFSCSV